MAREILTEEHIHLVEYREFLSSEVRSSLITAPTQVGKTNAICEFMKVAIGMEIPVILSCDNKTNQLDQICSRVTTYFDRSVSVIKVSNKMSDQILENVQAGNQFIIVCLDNFSQISKVKNVLNNILTFDLDINKIAIIHDEGDVVTKHANIETIEDSQSKSHQEWLSMIEYFESANIDLKRIFVSATPENVVYKYGIEKIISLIAPNDYIGYQNINYKSIKDTITTKEDIDILTHEQDNHYGSGTSGVILYCTDRKIMEGQDITLRTVCQSKSITCTVSTYNGNGITARFEYPDAFESSLKKFIILKKNAKESKITYIRQDTLYAAGLFVIQKMSIAEFYKLCKDTGNTVVITIGMDLMARGISFVSSKDDKNNTLAATSMIYRPGNTMHAVGLCQAIGRITGTARPDLPRTLYATQAVIENYTNFNKNQQQYLKTLRENKGVVSKEIMGQIELNNKLTRPLDRPVLKLNPKYKKETTGNTDEMKRLVNLWWNADTIIGKILKFVYEKEQVSEKELKDFIGTIGDSRTWYTDLHTGNKHYINIFQRDNNRFTRINENTREYIQTL